MYLLCLRVGKENKLLCEVLTSYYFKHVLLKKELDKLWRWLPVLMMPVISLSGVFSPSYYGVYDHPD
jgi:hypothetical protein